MLVSLWDPVPKAHLWPKVVGELGSSKSKRWCLLFQKKKLGLSTPWKQGGGLFSSLALP